MVSLIETAKTYISNIHFALRTVESTETKEW